MARTTKLVRRSGIIGGALTVMVAASFLLTGCSPADPTPSPRPTVSPSATTESPSGPEFVADGSAADNRAYFDSVNASFLAPATMPGGRPIIDNLVAAGFDRAAMEVTPDQTAIGGAVDAVQFSVRIGDECLVGQTSASAGYIGTLGPTVDGTSCLPGNTRPIDW